MPDFRVAVRTAAGVGTTLFARVGGSTPAVLRRNSVAVAVQATGVSGPVHALGAGVFTVATAVPVPVVLAAADPFDSAELDRMQQRQFTGGRPSGAGEAFQQIREMYRNRERSLSEDARRAAAHALALQEAVLRRYNENAARLGLPQIELPSDVLGDLVDAEGHSIGDPSGLGGAQAGSEVMPAWRTDP